MMEGECLQSLSETPRRLNAGPEPGGPGSASAQRRFTLWVGCTAMLIAGLTFTARWGLRCEYLLQFDTLQSAAAISHYDVALDMPHSPGAPVYVLILKGLAALTADRHVAVLLAACLFDAVAAGLVVWLATLAVSFRAGLLSGIFYLLSPLAFHSATIGLTFGLDAALAAGVGLTALSLRRRSSRSKAVLLAVLIAAALGSRYNANWASVPLLFVGLYGVIGAGRGVQMTFGAGLILAVMAWLAPAWLWAASEPGYLTVVSDFYQRISWKPSAVGVALDRGWRSGLGAYAGTMLKFGLALAKTLGVVILLFPFAFLPARRAFQFTERPPWGLLAAWLLPALLLPAAGMHHVEEYVAVAAPALMMIAAIGLLRAAGLMRSLLSLCGLRRDSSVDRLEGAFAVTHLLVIGLLNAQVLFMLFSVDVSNSRVISGRPLKSLQEQLHKEGDPLPREDLALRLIEVVQARSTGRPSLVIARNRFDFLFLSLYAPEDYCLHVANGGDGAVVHLAHAGHFEIRAASNGQIMPLPDDTRLVYAPEKIAGRELVVTGGSAVTDLQPADRLALGSSQLYTVQAGSLELRDERDHFVLSCGPAAGPQHALRETGRRIAAMETTP